MERGKKLILAVALGLAVCIGGCASITVNPESGEIAYFRAGDQRIGDFSLTRITPEGELLQIKFHNQESELDLDALRQALLQLGILGAL